MGKREKEDGFVFSLGTEVSYTKPVGPTEEGHEPEGTQEVLLSLSRMMILLSFPCPPPSPIG